MRYSEFDVLKSYQHLYEPLTEKFSRRANRFYGDNVPADVTAYTVGFFASLPFIELPKYCASFIKPINERLDLRKNLAYVAGVLHGRFQKLAELLEKARVLGDAHALEEALVGGGITIVLDRNSLKSELKSLLFSIASWLDEECFTRHSGARASRELKEFRTHVSEAVYKAIDLILTSPIARDLFLVYRIEDVKDEAIMMGKIFSILSPQDLAEPRINALKDSFSSTLAMLNDPDLPPPLTVAQVVLKIQMASESNNIFPSAEDIAGIFCAYLGAIEGKPILDEDFIDKILVANDGDGCHPVAQFMFDGTVANMGKPRDIMRDAIDMVNSMPVFVF